MRRHDNISSASHPRGQARRTSDFWSVHRPVRTLAVGRMTEVLLAEGRAPHNAGRQVAVKRVRSEGIGDRFVERLFEREARLTVRLAHPNVVLALDAPRDVDGRPHLVMQYVDGVTLASLMQAGPLPSVTAVHIASKILAGLGYLHGVRLPRGKHGVAHFNMSPSNVLLSFDGLVKIADFGAARVLSGPTINPASIIEDGGAGYTSPEQLYMQDVDARADLFAAGVILWELLAGKPLFGHQPPEGVAAELNFHPIPRLGIRRSDISPELEQVVMQLLARDPRNRYQTASAAIADLASWAAAPQDGARDLAATIAQRPSQRSSRQDEDNDDEGDGGDDEPRRSAGREEHPRIVSAAESPVVSMSASVRSTARRYDPFDRPRPEPRSFSQDEYLALLAELEYSRNPTRDLALAHVLYHCKLHVATAVTLTVAQLHLGKRVLLHVRLPEASEPQDMPLNDVVYEAIEQYIPHRRAQIRRDDSTALFLWHDGEPLPLDDAYWILSCHSFG